MTSGLESDYRIKMNEKLLCSRIAKFQSISFHIFKGKKRRVLDFYERVFIKSWPKRIDQKINQKYTFTMAKQNSDYKNTLRCVKRRYTFVEILT